jgi:hypothetical protein
MAFSHGKSTAVTVDNAAGTPTAITAYTNESSWPQEIDATETTVFGQGSKTYIVGLADSKFSCGGLLDPTLDTLMTGVRAGLIAGTVTGGTSTIEYAPAGTATGNPKYTAEGILTSYEVSSGVGDADEWKAEYQITGAVTRTTY